MRYVSGGKQNFPYARMGEMKKREEKRVLDKIKQFQEAQGDWQKVHEKQKVKRLAWFKTNKGKLNLSGSLPRQAYTMVLLEYMGLGPDEVPVIEETETKIIWRSYNFCPVLEACQRLGLDTREVCREGYEESIQDLITCLDPRLKFSRNYENLRPYGEYCEEAFELVEE